jgi:hypothetical protein
VTPPAGSAEKQKGDCKPGRVIAVLAGNIQRIQKLTSGLRDEFPLASDAQSRSLTRLDSWFSIEILFY